VDTHQPTKRKAEKVDDVKKPPVKKMKNDAFIPHVLNMPYKAQVRGPCEVCIIHAVTFQSGFELRPYSLKLAMIHLRGSVVVKALDYKLEGRGFETR
jgi:hypothetical protein